MKQKPASRNKFTKTYKVAFVMLAASFLYTTWAPDLRFGPDIRFSTKAIHPDADDFRAMAFRFEDYDRFDDAYYVLGEVFKVGASKEYIDTILTTQNFFQKSWHQKRDDDALVAVYKFQTPRNYRHGVWFCRGAPGEFILKFYLDDNERLQKFSLNEPCRLWPHKAEQIQAEQIGDISTHPM